MTKHLYYSGNVQGVGFRYTAARIAQRHHIGGYVRNLPDRRVEVMAQAGELQLQSFLDELRATMCEYISEIEQQTLSGDRAFGRKFEIVFQD